jgi:hypothetical protein
MLAVNCSLSPGAEIQPLMCVVVSANYVKIQTTATDIYRVTQHYVLLTMLELTVGCIC